MQQSNLEPFLKTGTTLAVLSTDGKEPEEKERLNKSASCLEICFRRIKILFGILKGPLALLMLREDMMLAISSRSVGWINIELLHWCFKYSEKCFRRIIEMFCFAVSATEANRQNSC